jgi:hypothetical protein
VKILSEKEKVAVAKHASVHSIQSARQLYSRYAIPRSTIYDWKKSYEGQLLAGVKEEEMHVSKESTGRPRILSVEQEKEVIGAAQMLKASGLTVNQNVLMGTAKGLTGMKVSRGWVDRFKERHNLVRRKATGCKRKLPSNLEDIADKFVHKIKRLQLRHDIPADLILNMDETGSVYLNSTEADALENYNLHLFKFTFGWSPVMNRTEGALFEFIVTLVLYSMCYLDFSNCHRVNIIRITNVLGAGLHACRKRS